ncbi:MAG: hypothetical protein BWY05_00235 [Euryarchaeota archaeon ADurb.Bin165]|nr:MAG: hypothetical protein BWY05_00235 [Euryarchaeota archaeon ADurb.Bin165]
MSQRDACSSIVSALRSRRSASSSALLTALTIRSSILLSAENLTSRLVGCMFASTSAGGISSIRTATGQVLPGTRDPYARFTADIIAGDWTRRPLTAMKNRCLFCFTSFGRDTRPVTRIFPSMPLTGIIIPASTGYSARKISGRSEPPWVENLSSPFTRYLNVMAGYRQANDSSIELIWATSV